MCGIAGIMYYEDREPSTEALKRMSDEIIHRGPDDSGFWTDNRIGLAFRRLSIIDLQEGHQPLTNEDGEVWIVFNGEIYNYKELRDELITQGHQFRTHSDTEVIVHLYEELGENCVDRLRGMFSFVIWDRRKKQLFGARDPFGIKPFYYYSDPEQFLFGSEIKSILTAEGMERRARSNSLYNYLTFQYVPEPFTMFEGIMKLPPAHSIRITYDGAMRIRRYWDPMFTPDTRSLQEDMEELRARLADSVSHHMVSDVDRGCFLSSGIDSTAIAALMRQREPIRTFSVGFDGPNNETEISRDSAHALGTDHFAKLITEEDFFSAVPRAIWHQDEPVADPSAIALYHVAQLASEHVTVVLSGEGADELFGGYRIYREPLSLRPLTWLPLPMRRAIHQMAGLLPDSLYGKNYILRGTTPLEERFLGNAKIFSDDLKDRVLRTGLDGQGQNPWQIAAQYYEKTKHLDPVTRMQYIDMNLWLPGDILMKADKMTMAHSLELRVPFLDKELFDLARRIPMKHRLAGGTTKYVFRKAAEGIVPDFILNRPKLGFPVPMRHWMKGRRGKEMLEVIRSSGIEDYIQLSEAESLLHRHQNGQGDYSRNLWILYVFALWHQTYIKEQPVKGVSAS